MENSTEEDIKNAEHFIKSIKKDKEYKEENGWHGYYNKEIVELARILENILSDYKRVLKENEELKQDRNNNYQMIALAQNEALGYMQGYEDGKKLKRSAVANIVENQQYYIIKKQIEKYKTYIEQLRKELGQKDKIIQNMSKYILSLDIDKDICMKNTTNTELCNEDNSNCVECIIKHFSN